MRVLGMIGVGLVLAAAGPASGDGDRDLMAAMTRMDQAMQAPMSGDVDRDFAAMMIPHHQAAIDMARVELRDGRDPAMRELARQVIAAQEAEIARMRGFLDKSK
jgi:uncharacterized protein (DUF305 family)